MTVNYRYIGKGKTDANGVAHITEDANGDTVNPPGYVGTGAGELDIVASVDKPISSGSVVSEPYKVLDGVFKDIATTGKKETTRWRNNNTSITVGEPDDNGTLLSQVDTSATGWYLASTSTTDAYWSNTQNWTPNFAVEFDLVSRTYGSQVNVFGEIMGLYSNFNDGDHIKITYDGTNLKFYQNDNPTPVRTTPKTASTGEISFRIVDGGTLKYKNFVIYPI